MASQGDSDAALRHLASSVVLGAALVLIVVKIWGWVATGSMALLTSAADGVVDLLAATATFFGVRFAERPADAGHRFGGTACPVSLASLWNSVVPNEDVKCGAVGYDV